MKSMRLPLVCCPHRWAKRATSSTTSRRRRTGAFIMRRRGAWRIGTGGSNLFFIYNHALNHAGFLSGVVGPDATARGSPRPLGLRPGRTGLPASCGAGKAGRRPCASPYAAAPSKPVKLGPAISKTKKARFSRSEASSGRTYKCLAGSRGGAAHNLLALLVKVKAHSLSADGARPRKASNATRGALEKLQTQLGGPTPSDKNGGSARRNAAAPHRARLSLAKHGRIQHEQERALAAAAERARATIDEPQRPK